MESVGTRQGKLPSSNSSKKMFAVDEKVVAIWMYSNKYPATIKKILPNDKYEIVFYDGVVKTVPGCKIFKVTEEELGSIQLPSSRKPAPPMGADPLDPDLGPKEERKFKTQRRSVYEALRSHKKNRSDNPEYLSQPLSQCQSQPAPHCSYDLSQTSNQCLPPRKEGNNFRGRGRPRKSNTEKSKYETHDGNWWEEEEAENDIFSKSLSQMNKQKHNKTPSSERPSSQNVIKSLEQSFEIKEERKYKTRGLDDYEVFRKEKKHRSDQTMDFSQTLSLSQPVPKRLTHNLPKETSKFSLSQGSKSPVKGMPKISLKKRGRPRKNDKKADSDETDNWWMSEDDDDNDDIFSQKFSQGKKLKAVDEDSYSYSQYSQSAFDDDYERWNTEFPESATPVQIKDMDGSYRESVIIPDRNLPAGWTKHTMKRKTGTKWDVFLVNEDGRKFRSRIELRKHFAKIRKPYPEESFDFKVGRKMERIQSQTETESLTSNDSSDQILFDKSTSALKKIDRKEENHKNEFTPDRKGIKIMLPKNRSADSKHDVSLEDSSDTCYSPPFIGKGRRYSCCGYAFRKNRNLLQAHVKNCHLDYSTSFYSTLNVTDSADIQTVKKSKDSQVKTIMSKDPQIEKCAKVKSDTKTLNDTSVSTPEVKICNTDANAGSKVNLSKDKVSTEKSKTSKNFQTSTTRKTDEKGLSMKKNKEEVKSKDNLKFQKKSSSEKLSRKENNTKNESQNLSVDVGKKIKSQEGMGRSSSSSSEKVSVEKSTHSKNSSPQNKYCPSEKSSSQMIKPTAEVKKEAGSSQDYSAAKSLPVMSKKMRSSSTYTKDTPPAVKKRGSTIKTLLPVRTPATNITKNSIVETKEIKSRDENKKPAILTQSSNHTSVLSQSSLKNENSFSGSFSKKSKQVEPCSGKENIPPSSSTRSSKVNNSASTSTGNSNNRPTVTPVTLQKVKIPLDKLPIKPKRTCKPESKRESKKPTFKDSGEKVKAPTVKESKAAASETIFENLCKEEIINCICGIKEEDGLMIQCDLCQCWQHSFCNKIHKEEEVPAKYICQICQNPPGQRSSSKFMYCQEWLQEGKLPSFSFTKKDPEKVAQREKFLKDLSYQQSLVYKLDSFVQSLFVKNEIASAERDHPKLILWNRNRTDENPESDDELDMNDKGKKKCGPQGPKPEVPIDFKECRERLLDEIESDTIKVDNIADSMIDYLKRLDPDDEDEENSDSQLIETAEMLERDLNTVRRFAHLSK